MIYLLVLLIFGVLPLFYLWIKYPHLPKKYHQTFFMIFDGVLIFSIPWEAISVNKIWFYDYKTSVVLGPTIFGFPVEELLFFIVAALLTASTTLVFKKRHQENK